MSLPQSRPRQSTKERSQLCSAHVHQFQPQMDQPPPNTNINASAETEAVCLDGDHLFRAPHLGGINQCQSPDHGPELPDLHLTGSKWS